MWTENKVFLEDLEYGSNVECIPWERFSGKTFFITGATGLIGYTLASLLLYRSAEKKSDIRVVALVRDRAKAREQFGGQLADGAPVEFVEGAVEDFDAGRIARKIDYVIHGACPTASTFFTEHPVETIRTIVNGTDNMLRLCVEKHVQSVAFLSSMEVYGEVSSREKLAEDCLGKIDLLNPRSSYPEAKRLAENLCACYASEFGLDVKSVRLAQTFGPGVRYEDARVFAYMMRCALENKNIELKTSGVKENPYLYTMDAATAILTVLAKGERGRSYNAANEETYCSVREMGEVVLKVFGKTDLKVLVNAGYDVDASKYPPESSMNLSSEKLQGLDWSAHNGLQDMYARMNCSEISEKDNRNVHIGGKGGV
ncbi:MAG: NAD(P)-dependent oxidoreductase [Treponema sp.]|nr:NAD(P)-dependent oxidoreductase [Treponema sp.]MBD5440123.1 NAD(P)-dependent oxidoreductase [Treponema sp.]